MSQKMNRLSRHGMRLKEQADTYQLLLDEATQGKLRSIDRAIDAIAIPIETKIAELREKSEAYKAKGRSYLTLNN